MLTTNILNFSKFQPDRAGYMLSKKNLVEYMNPSLPKWMKYLREGNVILEFKKKKTDIWYSSVGYTGQFS